MSDELIDPVTGKPPNPLDPKAVNRAREAAQNKTAAAPPPASPVDKATGINFFKGKTEEELRKEAAARVEALRNRK